MRGRDNELSANWVRQYNLQTEAPLRLRDSNWRFKLCQSHFHFFSFPDFMFLNVLKSFVEAAEEFFKFLLKIFMRPMNGLTLKFQIISILNAKFTNFRRFF